MTRVTMILFFLLMANYHKLCQGYGHLCEPCQENKQCNISYTLQDEPDAKILFSWQYNSNEVMTCYTIGSIHCVIYPMFAEYISFSTQTEPGSITLSLIFLNISRQSKALSIEGTWTLKAYNKNNDAQLVFTCEVTVFRKPTDIYCEYTGVKQGVLIQCIGEMSYPEIACTVYVQVAKDSKPQYIEAVYNNVGVKEDPMYYKSKCLAIIPCELLIQEFIRFDVNFVPLDVNSSENLRGGSNYSSSFKIDYLGQDSKHYTLTDKQGTQVNVYCLLNRVRDNNALTIDNVNNLNATAVNKTTQTIDSRLLVLILSICILSIFGLILVRSDLKSAYRRNCLPLAQRPRGSTLKYRRRRRVELNPESMKIMTNAERFLTYRPIHQGTTRNRVNFSGFNIMHLSKRSSNLKKPRMILPKGLNEIEEVQSELMEVKMTSLEDAVLESATIMYIGACQKNRKHDKCIQINDFTISKLPHKYQDKKVFDYIKIVSELTGRMDIYFTSPYRPDVDPNTQARYPGWDTKNTKNMRTGTGTVVSVLEVRDDECPCPECEESPSKEFYLVYVLTAKHVVFDDTEARQSCFRIDYNTEKSPLHRLYGLRVVEGDMNDGRSHVVYVTHESKVGIHLSDLLTKLSSIEKKIPEHFHTPDNTLVTIVSHPHGEPKHVTIGEWVERELISTPTGVKDRYFYKTDTCQGSSGAAVIVLGDMLPRVTKRPIEHHIYHTTDNDGLV